MLLFAPRISAREWQAFRRTFKAAPRWFLSYCREYVEKLQSQPWSVQQRALSRLISGMSEQMPTSDILHRMIERVAGDEEIQPEARIHQIVVLHSFVESLRNTGFRLRPVAESLLRECEERIPALLVGAVDRHFARVPGWTADLQ